MQRKNRITLLGCAISIQYSICQTRRGQPLNHRTTSLLGLWEHHPNLSDLPYPLQLLWHHLEKEESQAQITLIKDEQINLPLLNKRHIPENCTDKNILLHKWNVHSQARMMPLPSQIFPKMLVFTYLTHLTSPCWAHKMQWIYFYLL